MDPTLKHCRSGSVQWTTLPAIIVFKQNPSFAEVSKREYWCARTATRRVSLSFEQEIKIVTSFITYRYFNIFGKMLCCLPISLFHIYFLYIWKHFVKIVNDSPPLVYGIQCHLSQTHPGVSMAMHRLQDVHRLSRLRWPCKLPTACENALIHFGRWYHYWRVKKTKKISWWLQVLVWLLICRTRCCFVTPVIRGIIWPAMNRP